MTRPSTASSKHQAYETNSDKSIYGKEKLTKVLELIKKARMVARSRATDQSNMEPIAANVVRVTTNDARHITLLDPQQVQTTPLSPIHTYWTALCRGGMHTYPTPGYSVKVIAKKASSKDLIPNKDKFHKAAGVKKASRMSDLHNIKNSTASAASQNFSTAYVWKTSAAKD